MNKKTLKKWGAIALVIVILVGAAAFFVGSDLARAQGNGPGGSERDFNSEEPAPQANGELTPLYHFANVLNDVDNGLGTAIICSNIDETKSTVVEVQIYDFDGTYLGSDSILVYPFRTATFETTQISFYLGNVIFNIDFLIMQGYGRILTEHKNVICTVQILDADNSPPTWMENIPVWGHSGWGSYLPMITN